VVGQEVSGVIGMEVEGGVDVGVEEVEMLVGVVVAMAILSAGGRGHGGMGRGGGV